MPSSVYEDGLPRVLCPAFLWFKRHALCTLVRSAHCARCQEPAHSTCYVTVDALTPCLTPGCAALAGGRVHGRDGLAPGE
jgi:hypothetical protein